MKNKYHDLCTIMRRVEISTGTFNIATGKIILRGKHTEIQPCGTPLFSELERKTGICSSCRKGWHAKGNEFANDEERARARGDQS